MHSIDEMCRAGCTSRRGVRYWEEQGLLGEVGRTPGDHRIYTPEQLDLAKIIAAAQFGGFDLEMIGQMVVQYDAGVHDALLTRLEDQVRAASRLAQNLPKPAAPVVYEMVFDL